MRRVLDHDSLAFVWSRLSRAIGRHLPSCITSISIDPKYKYPGNELRENGDANNNGVPALAPAVDDQFSKM